MGRQGYLGIAPGGRQGRPQRWAIYSAQHRGCGSIARSAPLRAAGLCAVPVNWTNASEWTLQTVRPQLDGSGMVREEIGYTVRRFVDDDAPPMGIFSRVMDPCATCLKHKFDICRSLGTPPQRTDASVANSKKTVSVCPTPLVGRASGAIIRTRHRDSAAPRIS
jgi:hypothetical protein